MSTEHSNITVCFWPGQKEIIEAAAKKRNMSVADWVRERLVPAAAQDAGVPLPSFPQFAKRGRASKLYLAAQVMGVSVRELRRQAAESASRAILESFQKGRRSAHPRH